MLSDCSAKLLALDSVYLQGSCIKQRTLPRDSYKIHIYLKFTDGTKSSVLGGVI